MKRRKAISSARSDPATELFSFVVMSGSAVEAKIGKRNGSAGRSGGWTVWRPIGGTVGLSDGQDPPPESDGRSGGRVCERAGGKT